MYRIQEVKSVSCNLVGQAIKVPQHGIKRGEGDVLIQNILAVSTHCCTVRSMFFFYSGKIMKYLTLHVTNLKNQTIKYQRLVLLVLYTDASILIVYNVSAIKLDNFKIK